MTINKRQIFLIIFFLNLFAILYALYAQYHQHVEPCPLCIAQRVVVITVGILSLIFAIHNPKNLIGKIYGILIIIASGFGIKIASHHLWLMSLPADKQPISCGMPLNMMFSNLPLKQFLNIVLSGDAECGKVNWTVFGLNGPTMMIILCTVSIVLSIIIVFKKK